LPCCKFIVTSGKKKLHAITPALNIKKTIKNPTPTIEGTLGLLRIFIGEHNQKAKKENEWLIAKCSGIL
jgi:hypothetical protein